MIEFFLWVTEALTTWISGSLVTILFVCVLWQLSKWTEHGQVMKCYIYLWLSHIPLSNTSMLWRVSSSGTDWNLFSCFLYSLHLPIISPSRCRCLWVTLSLSILPSFPLWFFPTELCLLVPLFWSHRRTKPISILLLTQAHGTQLLQFLLL